MTSSGPVSYAALLRAGVAEPRARAMALEPTTTVDADDLAHLDTETAVQRLATAAGWTVARLSRPFRTRGVDWAPDQRWRAAGAAVWWEVKSPKDRLTRAQLDWLVAEHEAGQLVGCGGIGEARAWLSAWTRHEEPAVLGRQLVDRIAARGMRQER